MARLKGNSLHNAFTGKVGNLVGCKWKDTYYIRMRPAKVHHPNTEAQLAQRMKFTKTQAFLLPMKEFLRLGFGAYTSDKSAYNAAMSFNMKNAITGHYPDIVVEPSKTLVSMGNLPGCTEVSVHLIENDSLEFLWNTGLQSPLAHPNDKVILVVCTKNSKKAIYQLDAASRKDGKVCLNIHEFSDFNLLCYLIFVRPKVFLGNFGENDISDSKFCGTVEVK